MKTPPLYAILLTIVIGISACNYETKVNKPTHPASEESAWFEFNAKKINAREVEIIIVNTKSNGEGFAYTNYSPLGDGQKIYDLRFCFKDTLVIVANKNNTVGLYRFEDNPDGSGIGITWVTGFYVEKFFEFY